MCFLQWRTANYYYYQFLFFFIFFCCNSNKKDSVGNSEFSFSSFIRNISFINSFINRKRVLVGTLNEDGEMQPSSGQCQNCTLRVIRKLFSNAIFLFFRLNKKLFQQLIKHSAVFNDNFYCIQIIMQKGNLIYSENVISSTGKKSVHLFSMKNDLTCSNCSFSNDQKCESFSSNKEASVKNISQNWNRLLLKMEKNNHNAI